LLKLVKPWEKMISNPSVQWFNSDEKVGLKLLLFVLLKKNNIYILLKLFPELMIYLLLLLISKNKLV
jgi:hypothetical protein